MRGGELQEGREASYEWQRGTTGDGQGGQLKQVAATTCALIRVQGHQYTYNLRV